MAHKLNGNGINKGPLYQAALNDKQQDWQSVLVPEWRNIVAGEDEAFSIPVRNEMAQEECFANKRRPPSPPPRSILKGSSADKKNGLIPQESATQRREVFPRELKDRYEEIPLSSYKAPPKHVTLPDESSAEQLPGYPSSDHLRPGGVSKVKLGNHAVRVDDCWWQPADIRESRQAARNLVDRAQQDLDERQQSKEVSTVDALEESNTTEKVEEVFLAGDTFRGLENLLHDNEGLVRKRMAKQSVRSVLKEQESLLQNHSVEKEERLREVYQEATQGSEETSYQQAKEDEIQAQADESLIAEWERDQFVKYHLHKQQKRPQKATQDYETTPKIYIVRIKKNPQKSQRRRENHSVSRGSAQVVKTKNFGAIQSLLENAQMGYAVRGWYGSLSRLVYF